MADKKPLYCSFCGRSENEVAHFIAGQQGSICDECAAECHHIFQQGSGEATAVADKPAEPAALPKLAGAPVMKSRTSSVASWPPSQ